LALGRQDTGLRDLCPTQVAHPVRKHRLRGTEVSQTGVPAGGGNQAKQEPCPTQVAHRISIGGQNEVRLVDIDWHSTIVEDEYGLQQVIPNSIMASNSLDMRPNYRTLVFPFELKHQVDNITAFIDDCNQWLFAALRDIGADYEDMRPLLLLKSVNFKSIEVEALHYTNRQVSAYDIERYIYPMFLDHLRQREVLVQ